MSATAKEPVAKKPVPKKAPFFVLKNGKPTTLNCFDILVNNQLQMRASGTDPAYVLQLREAIRSKKKLARIKVMRVDDGGIQGDFVFDGMHTLEAVKQEGQKTVSVLLFKGTWKEALQAAAQANTEHDEAGRRATTEDKHRALSLFLDGIEGLPDRKRPSARTIAQLLNVSHTFVAKRLKELEPATDETTEQTQPAEGTDAEENEEDTDDTFPLVTAEPKPTQKPSLPSARLFDWTGFAADIGRVKRGLESLVDICGEQDTPAHIGCKNALETLLQHHDAWQKNHGKK